MFPKLASVADYKDLLRSTVDQQEVLLELPVKYEVKKDRYESKLLVLTQYRLYCLTPLKAPSKVEFTSNILDVVSLESPSRTALKILIGTDSKPHCFLSGHLGGDSTSSSPVHQTLTYDFDSFISAYIYAFRLIFPENSRYVDEFNIWNFGRYFAPALVPTGQSWISIAQ